MARRPARRDRTIRRRRGHDDGVRHRAGFLELAHHVRDRRGLLAHGDVDALHAEALLVEDRVDADRGLAGLAVADDELALAAPDAFSTAGRETGSGLGTLWTVGFGWYGIGL